MLYDRKRWEPKHVEIPAIEPWQQILIEVAKVIQKRGWAQGDFQDAYYNSVCPIGAFRVVQHGDATNERGRHQKYDPVDLQTAKRKFWSAIPSDHKVCQNSDGTSGRLRGFSVENIEIWNDECCQSKAEIIRYLTAAASWK